MTDRIRQIAEAYAANAGEVQALEQAIRDIVRDEREACAKEAEWYHNVTDYTYVNIAERIRARTP